MKRGFALAAVLFALTLLAASAAGGFFASLQGARAARNGVVLLRARSAAESAIENAVATWSPRAMNGIAPFASVALAPVPAPGLATTLSATRLETSLFLVRGAAFDGDGIGRVLAHVVRLAIPELSPRAAVRVRQIDAASAARIDSGDRAPPGLWCSGQLDTVPAVITQPGASDSAFFRLGPRDWGWLVARAAALRAAGETTAVRHVTGDMALNGRNEGGLLLVEGDVSLQGGASFEGVLLVRGKLTIESSQGATVSGAIVASEVLVRPEVTLMGPVIGYSSCRARDALLAGAVPEGVAGLSRVPIY